MPKARSGPVRTRTSVRSCAGIRMLMERDGARQFYALKAELEQALRNAESGGFEEFDPFAYEPGAGWD